MVISIEEARKQVKNRLDTELALSSGREDDKNNYVFTLGRYVKNSQASYQYTSGYVVYDKKSGEIFEFDSLNNTQKTNLENSDVI